MPETEPVLTNEQHDLINEWVFDMCEEYDLPLTNNEPRVQNGVQLRHVGEFTGDLMDLIKGVVIARMADAWDEGFKSGEEYAEEWHMPTTPYKEPNPYRATEEAS